MAVAEARTEEPTPRRLAEARRQGQVAFSRALSQAVVLGVVLVVLAVGAPAGEGRLVVFFREALAGAALEGQLSRKLATGLTHVAWLCGVPLVAALVVALVAGLAQTGGLLTLAPLRFEPRRVVPSLRRLLSPSALAEVVKGLFTSCLAAGLVGSVLPGLARVLAGLPGISGRRLLVLVALTGRNTAAAFVGLGLACGVADFVWQRWAHRRSLRMSRREIEREHRQHEGDPRHKAERQRLGRELAAQRSLDDVRRADFVIVADARIAVALRYDRAGPQAPVVVTKGERLVAARIKDRARAASIPMFDDFILARALVVLDEGAEIPAALYAAVAEIVKTLTRAEPG